MLTEQLLTENIEIDNEPVEQNTAHSLFFDTYYKSLTDIESSNRQLLDAQERLRWYTSQLDEVDRLADEARVPNSSTISAAALPRVIKLDRISDERDFKSVASKFNQFGNDKNKQDDALNNLKISNESHLKSLSLKLASLADEIKEIESKIESYKIQIKENGIIIPVFIAAALIISVSITFFSSYLWVISLVGSIIMGLILTLVITK
jgi:hypothetical protein